MTEKTPGVPPEPGSAAPLIAMPRCKPALSLGANLTGVANLEVQTLQVCSRRVDPVMFDRSGMAASSRRSKRMACEMVQPANRANLNSCADTSEVLRRCPPLRQGRRKDP